MEDIQPGASELGRCRYQMNWSMHHYSAGLDLGGPDDSFQGKRLMRRVLTPMMHLVELCSLLRRAAWVGMVAGMFATAPASSQVAPEAKLDLTMLVAQAERGDAISQNLLGALYQTGSGFGRDVAKAATWYQKAADQGLPAAQVNLATLYLGKLFKKFDAIEEPSKGRGQELLESAAARGDPLGIARLGSYYLRTGHGEKAIPLLLRAVDLRVGLAAFEMGNAYRWGNGVEKDEAQVKAWVLRSSDMGYPAGQYYRAKDYETDLGKQFDLYQRAAHGGDPMAQWALGMMYERVPQYLDRGKAAYWYTKAAMNGNEMGNQARFRLGLPDIRGNPPVNKTVLTTSREVAPLDDHTTVVAMAAAVGIALVMFTAGDNRPAGKENLSVKPYCYACGYGYTEIPNNMCLSLTTGATFPQICH
jgi:TPR repeat protein